MNRISIYIFTIVAITLCQYHKLEAQQLVHPADPVATYPFGLEGKNIALWQSHGLYFEYTLNRWEWQRARIHQTVEDLYTQSYVLPYLVPMLENSGAYLFLPRERDCSIHEYIIDNDSSPHNNGFYREEGKKWQDGGKGFGYCKAILSDGDNPFTMGSTRRVKTDKKGSTKAFWEVKVKEDSEHAVYISYSTYDKSSHDACYTIHHAGGKDTFIVDQSMGGGTWIYLGTFPFSSKKSGQGIELSNKSNSKGNWVSADAVKIGGGMGNIARGYPNRLFRTSALSIDRQEYQTSGHPRFTEGARYWLQWAGVPTSIYNSNEGVDDYKDDYQCRGLWVNWLAGGSKYNNKEDGLNIPIDLAFALHSDAGTCLGDSIVGTLAIYNSRWNKGKYPDGRKRIIAKRYAESVTQSVLRDINALHAPEWVFRGFRNKAYSEATYPVVPSLLLELLSHQNFPDMRYGLDPEFKFTVSRAIYKGILRFLASEEGRKYVVQPLPVQCFAIELTGHNNISLTWKATHDPLEPTALPTKYLLQTSIDGSPFDKGILTTHNHIEITIEPGKLYRYKVIALNDGGMSFPSEVLSAGIPLNNAYGKVLVVNGFTRISAPDWFDIPERNIAGFLPQIDGGVPYIRDISYTGAQKVYDRQCPWIDDDNPGFGDSYSDYETKIIAGNTFDYPSIHGKALLVSGYAFASCSRAYIEKHPENALSYDALDLILGKQKQTFKGPKDGRSPKYKALSKPIRIAIEGMANANKGILISGSYVASDLWHDIDEIELEEGKRFAQDILHYTLRSKRAAKTGEVKTVQNNIGMSEKHFSYNSVLSSKQYVVESPDGIEPTKGAETILRYSENNLSAGIAYSDNFRSVIVGFPIESINDEDQLTEIMREIMDFLAQRKSK